MARPKVPLDEKVVESLAKLGATNVDIGDHFGCDPDTIKNRCSDILLKARAGRRIRLRELQWRLAEQGNLGMLIWLGKQELGQSEKIEQKSQAEVKITSEQLAAKKEELRKILGPPK